MWYNAKNQSDGDETVGHQAIDIILGAVSSFFALSQFVDHNPGFKSRPTPIFLRLSNNIKAVNRYSSYVDTKEKSVLVLVKFIFDFFIIFADKFNLWAFPMTAFLLIPPII